MSSERERHESESSDQQRYLVKLRGLTSKITRDDIKKFLHRKYSIEIEKCLSCLI